jgi:Trp operon repressor
MNTETARQVRTIGEMARAASQRIKTDAEMMAAAMADMAQRRVRDQLAASAAQIARGIISANFRDADQGRILEGFMDKLRREARA